MKYLLIFVVIEYGGGSLTIIPQRTQAECEARAGRMEQQVKTDGKTSLSSCRYVGGGK